MEFLSPTRKGESKITEKMSRFLGAVFPVATEDEARLAVSETKSRYHDARHSPWCYLLTDGSSRSSDDGVRLLFYTFLP